MQTIEFDLQKLADALTAEKLARWALGFEPSEYIARPKDPCGCPLAEFIRTTLGDWYGELPQLRISVCQSIISIYYRPGEQTVAHRIAIAPTNPTGNQVGIGRWARDFMYEVDKINTSITSQHVVTALNKISRKENV